nr:MAG TPA: PolyVal ADP-Ribosyltransferase [Crassvirales sp.]
MIMCPNLQNPEVAKEFNELKEATSEKAAYHIWSANKGNNIDKAPNGAESILFNQILKLTNNDRAEAIRVKSKIYRRDFINWFGDWTDEDALSSKAVDLNGEPIMVWHGTDKLFDTFEVDSNNERGRHLFHDKNSFFFTDRQDKALKYKGAYTIPVYLNMRTVGKSDMTSGKFKTTNEYIDNENSLIKNDKYDSAIFVRYDKEGDNNGFEPTT